MVRKQKMTFDYMVIAISPTLVTIMVTSLALFVSTILNPSPFLGRFNFVLMMYSMATVAIARISIEEGKERAVLFGIPLAAVTLLAMSTLVQYEEAVGGMKFIYSAIIIAVTWWSAHQLTWDCTVIDEHDDSSGQGLLQKIGLEELIVNTEQSSEQADATSELKEQPDESVQGWFDRWKENRKKPHTPGVWVIYYSLAALPLFGFGHLFTDSATNELCFKYLFLYVASGLGLLLTTSFLGLRRYLRHRDVEMPNDMASTWLTVGVFMIAAFMIAAMILPRPGNAQQIADVSNWFDQSQDEYNTSENAIGSDGKDDEQGGQNSDQQDGASGTDENAENSGQSENTDDSNQAAGQSGENSEEGNQSSGEDSGNSASEQQSDQNNSGETNQSDDQQGQEKQGNQNSPNDQGTPENQGGQGGQEDQRDQQEQGDSEQTGGQSDQNTQVQQGQDEQTQNSSEQQSSSSETQRSQSNNDSSESEGEQNNDSSSSQSSFKMPSMPSLGILGKIFQLLFWAVIGIILILYLIKNYKALLQALREMLSGFMNWLAGVFAGTQQPESTEVVEDVVTQTPPFAPFSSFRNPFTTNAQMTQNELVKYSFTALESLGYELGIARHDDQTPKEFTQAIANHIAPLGQSALRLGNHYSLAAYAPTLLSQSCIQDLQEFWSQLSIVEIRSAPLRSQPGVD